jgi:hypothetical protein
MSKNSTTVSQHAVSSLVILQAQEKVIKKTMATHKDTLLELGEGTYQGVNDEGQATVFSGERETADHKALLEHLIEAGIISRQKLVGLQKRFVKTSNYQSVKVTA